MGGSNSTPVKQAERVESSSHQDLFEIRFDHLALGSTFMLIVLIAIAIYVLCRRQKKYKAKPDAPAWRTPTPGALTAAWPDQPFCMSPYPMMTPPAWWQMEMMLMNSGNPMRNPECRFTEVHNDIRETRRTTPKATTRPFLPSPNDTRRTASSV